MKAKCNGVYTLFSSAEIFTTPLTTCNDELNVDLIIYPNPAKNKLTIIQPDPVEDTAR